MSHAKSIGTIVKNLRQEARLSQKDAAKLLGCSAALLNHFESGRNSISLEQAFKFEKLCGDALGQVSGAIIREAWARAGRQGPPPASTPSPITGVDLDLRPKVPAESLVGLQLRVRAEDLRGSSILVE